MILGSTSSVSVVTIIVRRHFFRLKLDYDAKLRANEAEVPSSSPSFSLPLIVHSTQIEGMHQLNSRPPPTKGKKKNKGGKVSKDMIHRSELPVRVNQMNAGGWLREEEEERAPNLVVAGPTVEEPESILLDESPFQDDTASATDRKR